MLTSSSIAKTWRCLFWVLVFRFPVDVSNVENFRLSDLQTIATVQGFWYRKYAWPFQHFLRYLTICVAVARYTVGSNISVPNHEPPGIFSFLSNSLKPSSTEVLRSFGETLFLFHALFYFELFTHQKIVIFTRPWHEDSGVNYLKEFNAFLINTSNRTFESLSIEVVEIK